MTIAVDFDGTIAEDKYPKIGSEIPFAIDTLKMLIEDRHKLILWSVREGELLDAVNKDFPEEKEDPNRSYSRKIKADIFIDDRNVGGLPDWGVIYQIVKENRSYHSILRDRMRRSLEDHEPPKKKHWWSRS